jgi:drug/metabolite transporter (DMT)-like permease
LVLGFALHDLWLAPDVWPALGWLTLLALTSQVLGWLLITTSMPRLPAWLVGVLLMIQPAGSVALGAVLLGEQPSPWQLAGVGLMLAGVVIAASGHRREPASVETTLDARVSVSQSTI